MQKRDGDGFHPLAPQYTKRLAHIADSEWRVHFTIHRHPLAHLYVATAWDQRWRTLPKYVIHPWTSEATNLQFVTKPSSGDETSHRPLPFEYGVRGDRRPMHEAGNMAVRLLT